MRTFTLDIVAMLDGCKYGFHREVEAETYAAAYEDTKQYLRAKGWTIVKVRRA